MPLVNINLHKRFVGRAIGHDERLDEAANLLCWQYFSVFFFFSLNNAHAYRVCATADFSTIFFTGLLVGCLHLCLVSRWQWECCCDGGSCCVTLCFVQVCLWLCSLCSVNAPDFPTQKQTTQYLTFNKSISEQKGDYSTVGWSAYDKLPLLLHFAFALLVNSRCPAWSSAVVMDVVLLSYNRFEIRSLRWTLPLSKTSML